MVEEKKIKKKVLDKWFWIRYTATRKVIYFTVFFIGGILKMQAEQDVKLAQIIHFSILYDFYGELLGEHNKQIFEDYMLNDLSLSEIAENTNMTRQGVYDTVKRCSMKLTKYEEKLHLAERFEQTKQMVGRIKELSLQIKQTGLIDNIDEIGRISDEILNDW